MDNALQPATQVVSILDTNLPVIDYRGERVVTLKMVDQLHNRKNGTAGRNFREHRDRLIEGEDYHILTADEFRRHSIPGIPPRTKAIVLLTQNGYLLLSKSLTDDRAWRVQRRLVNAYFAHGDRSKLTEAERCRQGLLPLDLQLEALQAKVLAMAPKAEFYDAVTQSPDTMTMLETTKILCIPKLGRSRLFAILRQKGILFRENRYSVPYQRFINRGYFVVAITYYTGSDGKTHVRKKTLVTLRGLAYLRRLLTHEVIDYRLELGMLTGPENTKPLLAADDLMDEDATGT